MMIGFPLLMYYMWLGSTFYGGRPPWPDKGQSWTDFAKVLALLVLGGAYPHAKAWAIYWGFFIFEMACYCLLPGVWAKGKPLEHLGGRQLDYYCSGMWSLYVTLAVAAFLHVTGLFKLYTVIDEFGSIMSVAIISGFLVSFVAYFSALWRGAEHRMTGKPIYDFFMGAELNPRMFGILDFKMFFEVRIPWYILLLTTLSVAARQYEEYGYVSGEVAFLVMAHWLYANACSKGEDLIPPTWYVTYGLYRTMNLLLIGLGICTTKNGDSCLFSGTWLECLLVTVTALCSWPTIIRLNTAGIDLHSQRSSRSTSLHTGSGTPRIVRKTVLDNRSVVALS
jgi:delta24(24(1))-sterol reductase